MTKGRINGMYNWRLGWRGSILQERNGVDIIPPSNHEYDINQQEMVTTMNCDKYINAWNWWNNVCGNPKYVLAPMIGQSEMCFRLLCRQYGVHLCYTPMYLASNIITGQHDNELMSPNVDMYYDRPLICQLAGNNVEDMVTAAKRIQAYVDAVDINLGCPQKCADIGNYGSFLPERDMELVISIVTELTSALDVPVTAKIRIIPGDISKTVDYALRLQSAGISALCIHGRNRHQKEYEGPADWAAIKLVKSMLMIPVIANGSIMNYDDVQRCFHFTKADAVMSGTGLLRNPSLFVSPCTYLQSFTKEISVNHLATNPHYILHLLTICQKYLNLVSCLMSYPGTVSANTKDCISVIRDHFFAILQVILMDTPNFDLWSLLSSYSIQSIEQFQAILDVTYFRCISDEISVGFCPKDKPTLKYKEYSLRDIKNLCN